MKIKESENEMSVTCGNFILNLVSGIISGVLSVVFIIVISNLEPGTDTGILENFGNLIIIAFIGSLIWLCLRSFNEISKRLIINEEGVLIRSVFRKSILRWTEIEDWGLSFFENNVRSGEHNTFHLYFSKEKLKKKSINKKKVKIRTMKIYVSEDEYYSVIYRIIPCCSKYSAVNPFVAYIKNNSI